MRLYSIMNDFVSESDYITLDFFVKKYGVSKRTIQNDLSYLIQLSKDKGFYINFRRGYGYILEVNDFKKLKRFMDSLNSDGNMTNSQRIQAIGFYLVMSDAYVTMDQLAEEFNVSIATIKKEIKQTENLLMDFGLVLERRRHYGLHILCDDDKARDYVLSAYAEGNPYIVHSIHEGLQDFCKINSFLISQIEKNNFNINYAELKVVISQLEIITFYAMHKELSEYIVLKTNSKNVIHEISQNIKELIEGYYLVSLDKKSFELIQKVLLKNIRTKKPEIVFGNQLESDINDFLIEIDELYNTQFQKDESLKKSLITHVSLLIERLSKKISYQNLLIKEICARYPMIFNISIRFSEMLKTKYGVEVSQDEAGFIATHFAAHMEKERQMKMDRFTKIAVVCSSGGGSAYLIKMQIESLFKLAQVETFSFMNMVELESFHPDLIFTILPLEKEFSVPVIYIKELLGDLDLMQIKQVLQYENCDSFDLTETNNYLYSIFNKEFFQYKEETDYLKLIEDMALQIEMSGYGGDRYKEYVLQRENYMNTIYLNGICIAHPIELCANKNVVSVTVLKNPIVYQGKEARIVFMVSLKKEDTYIHKRITEKLFQFMNNEKSMQNILQHPTFENLLVTLKELDGGVS